MQILTVQGADGRALQATQPAGGVSGSPFTVSVAGSIETSEMTGLVIVLATVDTHIKFSKDGAAAVVDDIFIPANQWYSFPVDGDVLSMLGVATGKVHVELSRVLQA